MPISQNMQQNLDEMKGLIKKMEFSIANDSWTEAKVILDAIQVRREILRRLFKNKLKSIPNNNRNEN